MTKVTIHSGLTPKPSSREPDWDGFREALLLDDDYQVIIGNTKVPIMAARLESVVMLDTHNWPLVVALWMAVKGNTIVSPEAPPRWNELARRHHIPLMWDASGNISVATS